MQFKYIYTLRNDDCGCDDVDIFDPNYKSDGCSRTLSLVDGDKIVARVIEVANGKWSYSLAGVNHDIPRWFPKSEKVDMSLCMIPYEESFDTKQEAAVALLKAIGD